MATFFVCILSPVSKPVIKKCDENLIEKSKKKYINSVNEMQEYPNALISAYYAMELLGIDEPDKRKEEIMKVTRDDIIKLAQKINVDTIYLLGGEDNDE